jgi:hypothetical protein
MSFTAGNGKPSLFKLVQRMYQNRQEILRGVAMAESGGNYHMDAEGNAPRKADRRTPSVTPLSSARGFPFTTLINS